MAIYKENIAIIELTNGNISRSFSSQIIGEGDKNGDRFGFRLIRNGEPVSISGFSVAGYFKRADNMTVVIDGAIENDTAYVLLPESCYAVQGVFSLAIKLMGANISETLRIVDGVVTDTVTGPVIDPGSVIPDLDDYTALVERVEAAAEDIAAFAVTEELIEGTDYRLIIAVTE